MNTPPLTQAQAQSLIEQLDPALKEYAFTVFCPEALPLQYKVGRCGSESGLGYNWETAIRDFKKRNSIFK